jgi:hypothetical protein
LPEKEEKQRGVEARGGERGQKTAGETAGRAAVTGRAVGLTHDRSRLRVALLKHRVVYMPHQYNGRAFWKQISMSTYTNW